MKSLALFPRERIYKRSKHLSIYCKITCLNNTTKYTLKCVKEKQTQNSALVTIFANIGTEENQATQRQTNTATSWPVA